MNLDKLGTRPMTNDELAARVLDLAASNAGLSADLRTIRDTLWPLPRRCEACGDAPCSQRCKSCGCDCDDRHDRRCRRAPGMDEAAFDDRLHYERMHPPEVAE